MVLIGSKNSREKGENFALAQSQNVYFRQCTVYLSMEIDELLTNLFIEKTFMAILFVGLVSDNILQIAPGLEV